MRTVSRRFCAATSAPDNPRAARGGSAARAARLAVGQAAAPPRRDRVFDGKDDVSFTKGLVNGSTVLPATLGSLNKGRFSNATKP